MKNLILLLTFSSIFFLACNSDTKNPNEGIPDAQLWESFWGDFQKLVGKNDIQGVVKLIDFPLEGNFFKTNTGKGLSRAGVIKNYEKIIGNNIRLKVLEAKKEEITEMKVTSKEDAKRFGVPVGETMKVLTLNFVFDEGQDNQTESAQIFYFAKVKGEYKWCAMQIAG